ncbi:MAG: hypothetical protein BM485_12520 [Desulfobulbaceae bacterium DB1]|nr:MAG: hypothetical protein BM485_12520 [Desulfobulbaceae bacterium DB1]
MKLNSRKRIRSAGLPANQKIIPVTARGGIETLGSVAAGLDDADQKLEISPESVPHHVCREAAGILITKTIYTKFFTGPFRGNFLSRILRENIEESNERGARRY